MQTYVAMNPNSVVSEMYLRHFRIAALSWTNDTLQSVWSNETSMISNLIVFIDLVVFGILVYFGCLFHLFHLFQ